MLKQFYIFVALLSLQFLANAQTSLSITFSNPSAFHVCHESDYIDVEVRNITTSTVAGIQTQITLPTGITYVAGSISSTNVSEQSITDLSKPVFSVPNLSLATAATFKIKVKVACSIAAYLNSGGLPRLSSTTLYTGGSVSKNSAPMSIKQPTLLVSSTTNQIISANKGDVFVRRFTLTNTGSGKLKNFTFRRINQSGLTVLNAGGGTVSFSNDTTWSYVDSTDFVSVGNSDKFFDLNETFYLYDTIRVDECTNLNSTYRASWGCDGDVCAVRFSTGGVSISTNNPLLVITPRSYTSNCLSNASTHDQELIIYNNGGDTARNIDVNVFQSYNGGFYSLIFSKIEIGSIKYKNGVNGTLQSITPYNTRNTSTSGNFTCLGTGAKGAYDVKLPDLPVGDSIILVWKTRSCCPTNCQVNYWTQRWRFKASYENQCGTNLNYNEAWGSAGKIQSIVVSKFLPTDIRDGESASLEYTFSNGYLLTPIAASQLRVEVVLPAGLTHSFNASDLMFSHPNGTSWSPQRITLSNDTLTAFFRGVPTVTMRRSELKVTLLANCQSLSINKDLNYELTVKYNPDTSCSGNCWMPIYCDQDNIKIHCSSGCNAGLHFTDFEAKRTSFGQPDNNNDGVPDATGGLDFSRIKTNKVMYGDTLTAVFRARVNNAGSITSWQHGKATSSLNWGYYLDVADVRIRIYRVGNQLFNCNNIAYTSTTSGYVKTFTFDIGYNNLSASGCALYTGFGYINVDSIELEVKYVVSKNPGNAIRDLIMTNDFYLSSVANPSSSQKYQCDSFSSRTSLVGSYFTNYGANKISIDGCSPFFTYQNYYLSVGNCCGNYAGGNIFPYEYRPWAKLNGIILKKPSGFDINYSYLTQTRTKGTAAVATQRIDTIRPYSIGLTQLDFNTDSFYQDKGGPLLISDDGFYGTFATNFTPNCRATNGKSNVEYGFVFERLGFLGSGFDTVYTTTQNDEITYTRPDAIITPYNNYAYPAQDTVVWDLRITNNSSTSGISNFWFSAYANPNLQLVEVVDLSNNQPLSQQNDIFKLGTIGAAGAKDVRIKVLYQNCELDSFYLETGYDCTGYPDSLNAYPCLTNRTKLYFEPVNTRIEANLTNVPDSVHLCEEVVYTVEYRNTGTPKVFDSYIDIILRPGMVLSDTAWLHVDGRTDSTLIYQTSNVGPNTYRFDLAGADTLLAQNGFNGSDKSSGSSALLKFKLSTNCDFTSSSFFLLKPGGSLSCGKDVWSAFTIGSPINIRGVKQPYFSYLDFRMQPIEPCNYVDSTSISFINLGPDTTGTTDKIILSLPPGIFVDTTYIDNAHNAPTAGASYDVINGENVYSWQLSSGISGGDSSVFKIRTYLDNNLSCGTKLIYAQAVIEQPVVCIKDNSTCNIKVATSSDFQKDSAVKSIFNLQFNRATSIAKGNDEDISLNYTIDNIGADKFLGDSLFTEIVYDINQNGFVDGADVTVYTDTILNPILRDSMLSRAVQFTLASNYTCDLLIHISNRNCVCDETTIPITYIQLINAGRDTLVCPNDPVTIGEPGNTLNTYSWNNTVFIVDPDSSQSEFVGTNTLTKRDTSVLVLTTSKGSCSSNDTVLVIQFPGMQMTLDDSAQVCLGERIIIGDIVTGGNGVAKTYQWSPLDSLNKPNSVRTYVKPTVGTMYSILVTDGMNCTIEDSTYVSVASKPAADFSYIDTCTNQLFPFGNTTNYYGEFNDSLHWTFGNLGTSENNSPILTVDSTHVFPVRLYASNTLGCWDTITKLVEAYPLPTASLSLRASCEGDTTLFLASSQVVNGTVSNSWTIGSQVYNSDSVVYQMPNDTQVIVQLNTMSNYGCMDQVTDTIEVYDKPVIDLSLLDKCADDSIDFLVTELPGTRDIITSYNWTLGDGTTSMANGFKHFYADTGTYTVKVVVENANGCRDTTQETVSVFDIPTSLFSTTNACLGDSITVTSEASIDKGSIVSTLWDLGSGYQLGDSTFKIAATAVGTNSISQKVISDNGCEAEYQAPYTVYFVATPDITTTGNCENQIFTLNAIPSQADSVSDYKWRILSDSFNTSTTNYSFPSEGTYTLNLELTTNRGCISDSNFSVEVDSIPDVVIQTDVFCNDNLVRFETSNTGALAWDIGDGTTSSLDSFEHMYASLGSYPIELIVTNSYGCKDTGNTDVDIANIVNPSFRLSNVCVDESMWVVNTTTGLGAAISGLNFDMGNGIEIAALDSFQYSYPTAGTYTVTMTLTTLSGCSYTTQQNVTIYPLPQAGFTLFPESADVFTADIQITNTSIGADAVIYYLSDGTEYTAFDFNHKFADSGRYTINQFVESINGCMDSTSRSLYIQFAYKLFIPNTFTPNNDGKNEEFKPVGLGMKSFEMQIFNRWGEKVFESQQANQAWDGKDAIQGYYTYIIRARDYQGRIYNYKGHVYMLH